MPEAQTSFAFIEAEPLAAEPNRSAPAPEPEPPLAPPIRGLQAKLELAALTLTDMRGGTDASSQAPLSSPHAAADAGPSTRALTEATAVGPPARTRIRALDTAAKLAMDADAAAEALDNLKRLLAQGLPTPAQAASHLAAVPSGPTRRVAQPPQLPPPAPAMPAPAEAAAPLPPRGAQLVPVLPGDRAHFDLRGFLAGFALSWAIGIVLYLFITAG
jgi:hypothetical protein